MGPTLWYSQKEKDPSTRARQKKVVHKIINLVEAFADRILRSSTRQSESGGGVLMFYLS